MNSSFEDLLTCDKVFWKSLGVVEDDKQCWVCKVVCHAIIPKGHFIGGVLHQWCRFHRMAAYGEVSSQNPRNKNKLVSV